MVRFGESAAALGCALLIACSFPADYAGTRYQCQPGGECPDGFACVAGYCELRGPPPDGGDGGRDSGGGTGSDAAGDGGGEGNPDADPGVCPSASGFEEDFSNDMQWEVTNETGCNIGFVSGQLQMNGTTGRCVARSAATYDLDGRVFVEAIKPEDGLVEVGFGISFGELALMSVRVVGGLELIVLPAGDNSEELIDSVDFIPGVDRFWGLRPDGMNRTIHWEMSGDGATWIDLGEYSLPQLPMDSCVRVEFDAIGTGNAAPFAAFDNLNRPL